MTSPLKQFLVISIVAVTLTVMAFSYLHVQLTEGYVDRHLDSHNKNLAIVLRNSILHTGLEQELLDDRKALSAATLTGIRVRLEQELRWIPVIKVKIYSRGGRVLFSSKTDEIGEDASDNPGYQSAMVGIPASGKVEPDHINEFDQVVEIQDVHQQYVPILSTDSEQPIGVFETYLDIHGIVNDVRAMQATMFWLMGSLLALIYLAIALTFLKTHGLLRDETRRREANLEELREMHANLEQRVEQRTAELDHARNFLQSVIDGIASPLLVIRPDFTIALMNRQAKSLIPEGQDPEKFRYCYQISHRLDEPCSRPDHPCSFAKVMEEGRPARVRHTHYDENNRPVIVDLLTTPLYSADGEFEGVIEVEHDVTQLVQMQSGLIASEARMQATMDNVPDAILTCSPDFIIESSNRFACRLFGGDKSQLVGRNLKAFFTDPGELDTFGSETATQHQSRLRRHDGSEFPAEIWIGPLRQGTGNPSLIVVIRDVTDWIQAQRELDTSRQQYFHHDKMVAIGQLAAGILHEVGNPIAAIAGAASDVKQSHGNVGDDDAISRNIELIEEQIIRLGKITREIADFASPKPRERELLDLNGLLRSTTQLLAYDRRFSSIGVKLELSKDLPAIVGVADQLTQVFMNLLINAMDACATRDRSEDCIVVSSELDGDHVHVCVEDSGVGMSQDTLAHVMELFYTTKPVGEGSGMGLSLCDTIVRAHQGTLKIESEEGVGTRVHVALPLDIDPEDGDSEANNQPSGQGLAHKMQASFVKQ